MRDVWRTVFPHVCPRSPQVSSVPSIATETPSSVTPIFKTDYLDLSKVLHVTMTLKMFPTRPEPITNRHHSPYYKSLQHDKGSEAVIFKWVCWRGVWCDTYPLSVLPAVDYRLLSTCVEKQRVAPTGMQSIVSPKKHIFISVCTIFWTFLVLYIVIRQLRNTVQVDTAVAVCRNTALYKWGNVVPKKRAVWRQCEAPKSVKNVHLLKYPCFIYNFIPGSFHCACVKEAEHKKHSHL